MNFNNLIDRYSVDYEVLPKPKGTYVGGEFVEDWQQDEAVPMRGAIVAIPQKRIYQSGGYLTQKDLQLFSYVPVKGDKIRYNNNVYSVEEDTDLSKFAGVYVYIIKWVSSFEEAQADNY